MCTSLQLLFTWPIPAIALTGACLGSLVPFLISKNPDNPLHLNSLKVLPVRDAVLFVLLFLNIVYHELFTVVPFSFMHFLLTTLTIFFTFCFIISPTPFIKRTYHAFDVLLKVICVISIVGWIMFLTGVPLPHFETETNNFYNHHVYYLFIFNVTEFDFLPRFAGMFLEPGHLGSTCCMMLFINRFKMKDWSNWIYILSILLSFSLAAYCLLGIGMMLYNFFSGKNVMLKFTALLVVIYSIYLFGITYNDGDNELNNFIISRLEVRDGELSGNNRTAPIFDQYYAHWLERGELFFGYGQAALAKNDHILIGTAGHKRFFFLHGIFGTLLVIALYAVLFGRRISKLGLGFLILFIICNVIRDYPYKEMWLFLFVMATHEFARNGTDDAQPSNVTTVTENQQEG